MKVPKRLIDFYDKPRENGIFYALSQNENFKNIFDKLVVNYHSMDMDYIINHSGLKTVSNLLEYFIRGLIIDDDSNYVTLKDGKKVTWDYVVTTVDQQIINDILFAKFYNKWNNLADTIIQEIDALNPYHMDIKDITNEAGTFKSNDEKNTGGNSSTDSSTDSSSQNDNNTFGFNTTNDNGVPADKSNETSNSNNHISSGYGEKITNENNSSRNNDTTRTISRNGNIGNKSAMQLIEEKREMLSYEFFNTVYNDLDSVLTRSKYIL